MIDNDDFKPKTIEPGIQASKTAASIAEEAKSLPTADLNLPRVDLNYHGSFEVTHEALMATESMLREFAGDCDDDLTQEVVLITRGSESESFHRVEEVSQHRNPKGQRITTLIIKVEGPAGYYAIGFDALGTIDNYSLRFHASSDDSKRLSDVAHRLNEELRNLRCWYSFIRYFWDSIRVMTTTPGKVLGWSLICFWVVFLGLSAYSIYWVLNTQITAQSSAQDAITAFYESMSDLPDLNQQLADVKNLQPADSSSEFAIELKSLEKSTVEKIQEIEQLKNDFDVLNTRLEEQGNPWVNAVVSVIRMMFFLGIGWVLHQFLQYLFPRLEFAIGDGKGRRDHRKRWRWLVGSALIGGIIIPLLRMVYVGS